MLNGLKALEYRGYDSAGVAIFSDDKVNIEKCVGHVAALEGKINGSNHNGSLGIAHTRWATHGFPNEINAHPHHDCSKRIFLVHNGIIENYKEIKNYLSHKGHKFNSETDTEIVAHLIEDFLEKYIDFKQALIAAMKMIKGAYALAIIDRDNPTTLYAVRYSSPLVIGVKETEKFLASDPSALVAETKNIIYLRDGEIAEIDANSISICNYENKPAPFEIVKLEWNLEQAQKGNFEHFMLKEIFEGPDVVRSAFRGRLKAKEGIIKLGGLQPLNGRMKDIKRLIILGCGTSYYAGLVGEYIFEEIAQLPTEVHIASEFRYRSEPFEEKTAALAISQSGETADTLAALKKAKDNGILALGLVNAVGSSISRETEAGIYNHAGPEIGVASTKAFLSQITILTLIALYLSKKKDDEWKKILLELEKIPEKIQEILSIASGIEKIAEEYMNYDNFLFLGRRFNYPVALEGALKLKEISYIHSEGYGAGEMKHGPIAMISEDFPTIAIVPQNSMSEKMYSNIEEIKARKGPIIAIATIGDKQIESLADDVIYIPETIEPLEPLLSVVPLQLLAYYIGVKRGNNVDKPRNLAKSVTVE